MFIDKNALRFNPYGVVTHDGVTYNGNVMLFADVVAALGIVEIPDPQSPEDFSDDTYFRTEQDAAPYVIYTRRPDEMIEAARVARATSSREAAYRTESDPLFFKEQRGDVPQGTWIAKIDEIKARFPK